jgi:hypothetical protein
VWVVPAWGDSVVKVQIAGVPGGQTLVDRVETEVAQVGADGVWFPTVCTYTRLLGGELEYRQVAKIEVKSLNRPIDPRVFTLAGMDLPSPIPVITEKSTPEKPVVMWDGTKLVDATPYTRPAHPSVVPRPVAAGAFRAWLWVASELAAVIAAFAAWRLRRSGV